MRKIYLGLAILLLTACGSDSNNSNDLKFQSTEGNELLIDLVPSSVLEIIGENSVSIDVENNTQFISVYFRNTSGGSMYLPPISYPGDMTHIYQAASSCSSIIHNNKTCRIILFFNYRNLLVEGNTVNSSVAIGPRVINLEFKFKHIEWLGGGFPLASLPEEKTPAEINVPPKFQCAGNPCIADEDTEDYLADFKQRYGITQNIDITVRQRIVNDTQIPSTNTVAVCLIGATGGGTLLFSRQIVYNKAYWDTQTLAQRRITLFHELGHCILLRAHDCRSKNFINQACVSGGEPASGLRATSLNMPLSMMYPNIGPITPNYITAILDEYVSKWNFFNPTRFFEFNSDFYDSELATVYNDIGLLGTAPLEDSASELIHTFSIEDHGDHQSCQH